MQPDFYTIKEFAEKLKCSTRTIFRAIENGRISAIRLGSKKGAFRIPATELQRMALFDLEDEIKKIGDNYV